MQWFDRVVVVRQGGRVPRSDQSLVAEVKLGDTRMKTTMATATHESITLVLVVPLLLALLCCRRRSPRQVESAYQQHLMRGEATEELLQMGQTNAALDILAQK